MMDGMQGMGWGMALIGLLVLILVILGIAALDDAFGNPSSGHWASSPAKAALEQARAEVAALLGSAPDEIVRRIPVAATRRKTTVGVTISDKKCV
jgi:hypothetical protein